MSKVPKNNTGRVSIEAGVIEGAEREIHERGSDTLLRYDRLLDENPEFALWLRRRAIEIAPDDLTHRATQAQLALEAIDIVDRQIITDGLRKLFELPSPAT